MSPLIDLRHYEGTLIYYKLYRVSVTSNICLVIYFRRVFMSFFRGFLIFHLAILAYANMTVVVTQKKKKNYSNLIQEFRDVR